MRTEMEGDLSRISRMAESIEVVVHSEVDKALKSDAFKFGPIL
jgi:hypothetical protein